MSCATASSRVCESERWMALMRRSSASARRPPCRRTSGRPEAAFTTSTSRHGCPRLPSTPKALKKASLAAKRAARCGGEQVGEEAGAAVATLRLHPRYIHQIDTDADQHARRT